MGDVLFILPPKKNGGMEASFERLIAFLRSYLRFLVADQQAQITTLG